MTEKRTFAEIMSSPRRVECEARFKQLADELIAAGYRPGDVAHGAMGSALAAAMKGGMATYTAFVRHIGLASAATINFRDQLADRMADIRDKAH